jgi:hypothetical protein
MDFVLVRTGSQEGQVRTWGRGLFKHTHSLTAFWGLPFEDIAVIGPRGGSKSKNWRWAAIFKEGLVAQRRSFVTGDRCQLFNGTLVLLTVGLARRLGRCQRHGGRASKVAWLQEEEGMIIASILWRSWSTVPIRDLKDPQQLLFALLLHKHLLQLLVEAFQAPMQAGAESQNRGP